MTGNNDKLRSLFLTALMVMSVFAMTITFAGAAAAASNDDVDLVHAVEYTDTGGESTIELGFDHAAENGNGGQLDVDNVTVEVDGSPQSVSDVTEAGSAVDGDAYPRYNVTGEWSDITPDQDATVTIENVSAAGGDADIQTDVSMDVDVTSRNVSDGATVYAGEPIAITDTVDSSENEDVLIRNENTSSVVLDGSIGNNATYTAFDTSNLDTGDTYSVTFDGETSPHFHFDVSDLGLSASADTSIMTDDNLTVDVSAIRGNSPLTAEAVDDDGVTTTGSLDGSGETTLDFGQVGADNYTIEVTDVDTGITVTTDEIEVTEVGDANAEFSGDNVISDNLGDIANIPIDLSNTEEATVTIGSQENGYTMIANVTDGNGDGTVTLDFNSYAAGGEDVDHDENDVLDVADGDDEVSVQHSTDLNGWANETNLESGSYNLNVTYSAADYQNDAYHNDLSDQGTLSLQSRSTEALTTWVVPEDGAESAELSDIRSDIGSSMTEATEIAENDDVVLQIEASGLEGVEDYHGLPFSDASNISLSIAHTNPAMNTGADDLSPGTGNTEMIPDAENDTYFVVLDMSDSGATLGDNYEANFSVNSNSSLASDGAENVYDTFNYRAQDSSLETTEVEDTDTVVVQPAAGQTVTGDTNLAPGTEVDVHMSSDDSASPFFITPTATVQADGTFEATTDEFEGVEMGSNFTASVRIGNTIVSPNEDETYPGVVMEEMTTETPEPTDTETAEPTDTETAEPTDTEMMPTDTETEDEPDTTQDTGPGFGIAVGLIALIGAALLAVRRNN